ncbi:hypothetical protein ACA910_015948 [Epithemia clementina (nom. ined.)]
MDKFPVLNPGDLDDVLMDVNDPGEAVDDPERFQESRGGNFLMCPFQCNNCSFFNLKKRYPDESNFVKDKLLLSCIRRANLDAFWARERSTVTKNRVKMLGLIEAAKFLGIEDPLPQRGPFPVEDTLGMSTACAMLMKTLRQGQNTTQIQFETTRKVRSTVSNFVHTTPSGVGIATVG